MSWLTTPAATTRALPENGSLPSRSRILAAGMSAIRHRRFHSTVGKVFDLALDGRKAEALKMVNESGDYAQTSMQLVREMMAWKQQLS